MKTILEYLINNHVKQEKEIHSYNDLTDGIYYAVEYTTGDGTIHYLQKSKQERYNPLGLCMNCFI